MTLRRLLSLVVIAGLMVGCVNMSSTYTVRPDGSGTINERVTVNPQLAKMMKMQQRQDTTTASEELFSEEKMQSVVDTLEGLGLQSMERISGPRGEGYEATYAFDNLNEVRRTPKLDDMMPDQSEKQGKMSVNLDSATDVEMSIEPGSPATLTVTVPRDTADGPSFDGPGEGPPSDQQMRMMRKMMSDSGLRVAVEVDGEIVETDAMHRSGSTVTIMDMDFGELARDSTAFSEAFQGEQPESTQAFIENLNGKPGMAIEPKETVTIRFK